MVHGNWRFALAYELGVINGAFTWSQFDGGYGAVVGCSGGVYCIFGMHLAEIVTNWSLNKRGICNRWNKLLVLFLVLGSDIFLIIEDPSPTTSYTTHAGGMIYGYLCGIILFDDLERTWFHNHVGKPAALATAIILPLLGVLNYLYSEFPPAPLFNGFFAKAPPREYSDDEESHGASPCCWQLLRCGVDRAGYEDVFYCQGLGFDVYAKQQYQLLETCEDFDAAMAHAGH
jgi:hypothetical protein